jgi:hypothetical protein
MKWKSKGKDISPLFMHWICNTDMLIIPALENKKLPASTFSLAKSLVTLDWNYSFTKKNLNKTVFPNVKTVLMLNSNKINYAHQDHDFKILTGFEEYFIQDGRIFWNNTLVNKEWLESQYNEYICAMQEFHQLRENELR